MPPVQTHPIHRYLLWLGLLLAVLIAMIILGFGFSGTPAGQAAPVQTAMLPADAPEPTPADYVSAQKGFQYLVSYIDGGFEPATLTVQKGETVRFTNNADAALNLTVSSAQSPALSHGKYFEYTFTSAGSFTYKDSAGTTGTVTVK